MGYNDFMPQDFKENPILNSPYTMPDRHWALDDSGHPTGECSNGRRSSSYLVPIPAARRRRGAGQGELGLEGKMTENDLVNDIRGLVEKWRAGTLGVTPATQQLLEHWRNIEKNKPLFFCQVEAAETLIWLNEVAPNTPQGKQILEKMQQANQEANPELLSRVAAKMATGSGKTTVMAMLIAYHTINRVRYPRSSRFGKHFLIVTPGITIRDRLRVLLPQDPENYYEKGDIVPEEMRDDVKKAHVEICNYHVFLPRETLNMSKKQRQMIRGHDEAEYNTKENESDMLERTCKRMIAGRDVVVINDEAHHCYRHKTETQDEEAKEKEAKVTVEEREESERNSEAARVWISGLEALGRRANLRVVYDLSATPFFLRGSGYAEGRLFPWVVSDFSLMDAIEAGVVKVPRVPVDDAVIEEDLPVYRDIYRHVKERLPRKGRKSKEVLDPEELHIKLKGAMEALYQHYCETAEIWQEANVDIPPVFIVVCNNSATSKLIYDYIGGYQKNKIWVPGKLDQFSNIGSDGKPLHRQRTLLIDSYQLEAGDALSPEFKKAAAWEIEQYKNEIRQRDPGRDTTKIKDAEILREVMNTVGKKDKLGEQVRCVVSVSMLTEGWDANNVTHVLGIRAFGTQLLCEQVVGRALRRLSYKVNDEGKFDPEYADVFGVPFAFATAGKGKISRPRQQKHVHHLDEREELEITYPRVRGYKIRPPDGKLTAKFDENSRYTLEPKVTPPETENAGIIGEGVMMTLDDMKKHRLNEVVFHVAAWTAKKYYADENGNVPPSRFRDLVPIVRRWIDDYLTCLNNTPYQYFLWADLANQAAELIYRACSPQDDKEMLLPIIDSYNPEGSTRYVDFFTTKEFLYESRADKSHINYAMCDSGWEMKLCSLLENDKGVYAYARNAGLEFKVPYIAEDNRERKYLPDFIALINDRGDSGDKLRLVIETKGYRDENDRIKADTINRLWITAVNNHGKWGRWAFVEILNMEEARRKLAKYTQPMK